MIMQMVAWCASVLVFLSFFMKTMIPLRIAAITSNVVFISYALLGLYYGIFEKVFPIFVLHVALLPLNFIRLRQMKQLIKKIREASAPEDSVEYLIPYMQKEKHKKGTVLFNKGDLAENFYFIQNGAIEIPELKKRLQKGDVFGEVGLFLPNSSRSAGAVCMKDCSIYSIHKDKVLELYFQNPKFGFFIVRMLAEYAQRNIETIIRIGATETLSV